MSRPPNHDTALAQQVADQHGISIKTVRRNRLHLLSEENRALMIGQILAYKGQMVKRGPRKPQSLVAIGMISRVPAQGRRA